MLLRAHSALHKVSVFIRSAEKQSWSICTGCLLAVVEVQGTSRYQVLSGVS